MNWLIIFLALVVVIGPVMYLLPNAKDKRLTQLRAQARKNGLTVKITQVPKLDPSAAERVTAGGKTLNPSIPCTAYQLQMGQSLSSVTAIQICKLPENPTVLINEVLPGWALLEDPADFWPHFCATEGVRSRLLEIIERFPEDTLALGIDERSVACYWREKAAADSDAIDLMADALAMLRDDLCSRFGSVAAG